MRRCTKCHVEKTLAEFVWVRAQERYTSWCRTCRAESHRAYKATAAGKAAMKRYASGAAGRAAKRRSHVQQDEHRPAMRRAHELAKAAKKGGKLVPQPCADCGTNTGPIEMHHEDYEKPLDVTWLCRPCHLARHGKRAASAA